MLGNINLNGQLEILAETELEGYALKKWSFENGPLPDRLIIRTNPKLNIKITEIDGNESFIPEN